MQKLGVVPQRRRVLKRRTPPLHRPTGHSGTELSSEKKPGWDSTVSDLTRFKLSPEQLVKRKMAFCSPNNVLVRKRLNLATHPKRKRKIKRTKATAKKDSPKESQEKTPQKSSPEIVKSPQSVEQMELERDIKSFQKQIKTLNSIKQEKKDRRRSNGNTDIGLSSSSEEEDDSWLRTLESGGRDPLVLEALREKITVEAEEPPAKAEAAPPEEIPAEEEAVEVPTDAAVVVERKEDAVEKATDTLSAEEERMVEESEVLTIRMCRVFEALTSQSSTAIQYLTAIATGSPLTTLQRLLSSLSLSMEMVIMLKGSWMAEHTARMELEGRVSSMETRMAMMEAALNAPRDPPMQAPPTPPRQPASRVFDSSEIASPLAPPPTMPEPRRDPPTPVSRALPRSMGSGPAQPDIDPQQADMLLRGWMESGDSVRERADRLLLQSMRFPVPGTSPLKEDS